MKMFLKSVLRPGYIILMWYTHHVIGRAANLERHYYGEHHTLMRLLFSYFGLGSPWHIIDSQEPKLSILTIICYFLCQPFCHILSLSRAYYNHPITRYVDEGTKIEKIAWHGVAWCSIKTMCTSCINIKINRARFLFCDCSVLWYGIRTMCLTCILFSCILKWNIIKICADFWHIFYNWTTVQNNIFYSFTHTFFCTMKYLGAQI